MKTVWWGGGSGGRASGLLRAICLVLGAAVEGTGESAALLVGGRLEQVLLSGEEAWDVPWLCGKVEEELPPVDGSEWW